MAWVTPPVAVAGQPLTAAMLNMFIRNNMNETEVARAADGSTGLPTVRCRNGVSMREPYHHLVMAQESSPSGSFGDLRTLGPRVQALTETSAIVITTAQIEVSAASIGVAGYEISGATSIAASPSMKNLSLKPVSPAWRTRGSSAYLETGLTPGMNVFTMKYCIAAGNCIVSRRYLLVIPL